MTETREDIFKGIRSTCHRVTCVASNDVFWLLPFFQFFKGIFGYSSNISRYIIPHSVCNLVSSISVFYHCIFKVYRFVFLDSPFKLVVFLH